jgi:SAM-dependent methyltransferase
MSIDVEEEDVRMDPLIDALKRVTPRPIKRLYRRFRPRPPTVEDKNNFELSFWEGYVASHAPEPETEYYRRFMMRMGNIADQTFFEGKICLDIGCGPRGSLTWLTNAKYAIGLDPLAEAYTRFGIHGHNMLYLRASAERIPLVSAYADVVFSMNSLDHVDDLRGTCTEIRRVLRPGGHFIGSLNLNEPASTAEPWTLTESLLKECLFDGWLAEYYEVQPKVSEDEPGGPYRYFREPAPEHLRVPGTISALWCRFRVP